MNRPCLSLALLACLALGGVARAGERILAQSRGEPAIVLLDGGSAESPALTLKVGASSLQIQTEFLKTVESVHPEMPLQSQTGTLGEIQAVCVNFGLIGAAGNIRSYAIVFIQEAGAWHMSKMWTADCAQLGELGFTREKQSIAFDAKGAFTRQARSTRMEGVEHKLDCGCLTCDSRTTEIVEDEKWIWNAESKKIERANYERRYIVQAGEGVLTIARKALGDARLMARIYKLNPELKQQSVLQAGQKILVEKQ